MVCLSAVLQSAGPVCWCSDVSTEESTCKQRTATEAVVLLLLLKTEIVWEKHFPAQTGNGKRRDPWHCSTEQISNELCAPNDWEMRKQWWDALHASRIRKGGCSSWGRLYSWEYLYLPLLGKVFSFHDRHSTSQTFLSNMLFPSLSISITFPLQPKSGDFPWALHTSAGPAWELLYRVQTKPCSFLQLEGLQSVSQFLSVPICCDSSKTSVTF